LSIFPPVKYIKLGVRFSGYYILKHPSLSLRASGF